MPITYPTDKDATPRPKLLKRQKPIHAILGGGKVADILLWEDVRISGGITIGMTILWLLFEVVGYNFITFLCHLCMTAILVIFIWSKGAEFFKWTPPNIPKNILDGSAFREAALTLHARLKSAFTKLFNIACGNEPAYFFLAIFALYVLSVIGNYFTFLNFLYFGFICLQTIPFLYDRYEEEFDYLVGQLYRQARRSYEQFDSNVLNKIPRGPVKEKKVR